MTTSKHKARNDILVSVCLSDVPVDEANCLRILWLAQTLRENFAYWEIVLVVDHDAGLKEIRDLAAQAENLRLLVVREVSGFYRMRNVAASEAIGDVVVLTSLNDLDIVDLRKIIDLAASSGEAVVCTRESGRRWSPFFAVLRALSGYDINSADMLTAAYPRLWLNRLLEGREADLALRFPPSSGSFPVRRLPVSGATKRPRDIRSTARRVTLLGDVMSNSAPRLLLGTTALSLVVAFAGISYACYAVIVWLFKTDVQPGWLSTSLVLSLTATFLGCAISTLAMGAFKILDRLRDAMPYTIVNEYSNVDFFGEAETLNVEGMGGASRHDPGATTKWA